MTAKPIAPRRTLVVVLALALTSACSPGGIESGEPTARSMTSGDAGTSSEAPLAPSRSSAPRESDAGFFDASPQPVLVDSGPSFADDPEQDAASPSMPEAECRESEPHYEEGPCEPTDVCGGQSGSQLVHETRFLCSDGQRTSVTETRSRTCTTSSSPPERLTNLSWHARSDGRVAGHTCLAITEPVDGSAWNQTHLCWPNEFDYRLEWSESGPISGMSCTAWREAAEYNVWTGRNVWDDNYLCWPSERDYGLRFSSAGPLQDGMDCVSVNNPDEDFWTTWGDNYLCYPKSVRSLAWRSYGEIPGQHCLQVYENADPHTWSDNYLCGDQRYDLHWSQNGPLDPNRYTCIGWFEAEEEWYWQDNYLCWPIEANYGIEFSSAGEIPGMECTSVAESAEPVSRTWNDNYICWPPCSP